MVVRSKESHIFCVFGAKNYVHTTCKKTRLLGRFDLLRLLRGARKSNPPPLKKSLFGTRYENIHFALYRYLHAHTKQKKIKNSNLFMKIYFLSGFAKLFNNYLFNYLVPFCSVSRVVFMLGIYVCVSLLHSCSAFTLM